MDMDISMDIHEKSVDMDMDMDVIFHIHGNPGDFDTVCVINAQPHVTTNLMKLAVGERNVATNLNTIFRLC